VQVVICFIVLWLSLTSSASGSYLTHADQLSAVGAKFAWADTEAKTLRIFLEHKDAKGNWQRVNLGSGFLISPGGLFVTAYHVMKYCLQHQKQVSLFSATVDCSPNDSTMRYRALNGGQEFDIQIVSHLKESDSTNGRDFHTPDEIIKNRDFVIGRITAKSDAGFSFWQLQDYKEDTISLANPRADFELKPLFPPKRVFIAGYPLDREFEMAYGFLNLQDENHRGYFAANYKVYRKAYLLREGISPDTEWGMHVDNHMSGGAVIDDFGNLVGIVVNGGKNTAGILSIENIIENFFSRAGNPGAAPALFLSPKKTPLYLREDPTPRVSLGESEHIPVTAR
jgi:hypothetical protein